MVQATLDVSSVLAATGWSGATVANLTTSNDVRATDGVAGELIRGEFANAPGDFSSMSQIQIAVEARVVGAVSRAKTLRIELLDSADNVLETTDNPNSLTSGDVNYFSAPWSRTDPKSVVDGYRFRITVLEGGGMGDSATVEIDRIWATLTYTETGPPKVADVAATLGALQSSASARAYWDAQVAATLSPVTAAASVDLYDVKWTNFLNPGTVANIDAGGNAWSPLTASRLSADDGQYISAILSSDNPTDWLVLTNFGFALDAGAEIGDIELRTQFKGVDSSNLVSITNAYLTKNGTTTVGSNRATTTGVGTSEAIRTHDGGEQVNDGVAWGVSIIDTEVEASSFGFMLRATAALPATSAPTRLAPTQTVFQSGWSNYSIGSINEDPTAPDTNRLLTTGTASGTVVVGFPTPSSPLKVGTDLQKVRLAFTRTDGNSAEHTPVSLYVYESGVLRATLMDAVNISNTRDVTRYVERFFNASILSDLSGVGLEIQVGLGPTPSTGVYTNLDAVDVQVVMDQEQQIDMEVVSARVLYRTPVEGGNSVVATVAATLGSLQASATGLTAADAQVAATLGALQASATGLTAADAQVAATLGSLQASATGLTSTDIDVDAVLGALNASATGLTSVDAQVAATLEALQASASAGAGAEVTVAATLGTLQASATGLTATAAGVDATLQGLQASVAASAGSDINVAATLSPLVAAGQAATSTDAVTGATLTPLDASLLANTVADGQIAATLSPLAASVSASAGSGASVAAVLQPLDADATVQLNSPAAVASTLGALQASVAASAGSDINVAAVLQPLDASIIANLRTDASVSSGLQALQLSAEAATLTDASVAASLVALDVAALAGTSTEAVVPAALAALDANIVASAGSSVVVAAVLQPLGADAVAETSVAANVAADLQALQASVDTNTRLVGTVGADLVPLVTEAEAKVTSVGAVAAVLLPMQAATVTGVTTTVQVVASLAEMVAAAQATTGTSATVSANLTRLNADVDIDLPIDAAVAAVLQPLNASLTMIPADGLPIHRRMITAKFAVGRKLGAIHDVTQNLSGVFDISQNSGE